MFGELENLAVIDPLALEYGTGIMQAMRQHVDLGIAPGNHLRR